MYAVASLLYSPDYLPGALVLGHRLRRLVAANTELVLLVDLSRFSASHQALLALVWHRLVDTAVVKSMLFHQLEHDLKRPELSLTYTKIHLWALNYDKVLYLDADTLPLDQSATSVVDLLHLDFPPGKILAAPDSGFPDIFNSGVFGLVPNKADHDNLVALAARNDLAVSFDGADQGLLNQYFNANPDWVALQLAGFDPTTNWIPIPFLYNTTPTAQYEYLPAFNYFINSQTSHELKPGPQAPGSNPDHNPPLESQHLPPDELAAVANTLSSYGNAAARYFGSVGPLIKLVHFIGPLKPWKGQQEGVFSKWWDAWFEYSRGLSIQQKLGQQVYSISVKQLYAPGDEPPVEQTPLTPAELCNPANYQQFSSLPAHSTSAWDATREAPPVERPEETSFSKAMEEYESEWNQEKEDIQRETQEDEAEDDVLEQEEQELQLLREQLRELPDAEEKPYFGFHPSQVPERVFDKRSNYSPTHSLLKSLAAPKKKVPLPDIAPLRVSPKESPASRPQPKVPVAHAAPTMPKIFPWEHKNLHRAERTFD